MLADPFRGMVKKHIENLSPPGYITPAMTPPAHRKHLRAILLILLLIILLPGLLYTVYELTTLSASEELVRLQGQRAALTRRIEATNRRLAAVAWKKLQGETSSLQEVVARRRLVWSQLLADLERVVPWGVRVVSVNTTVAADGTLQIGLQGLATSRDGWLKLVVVLFNDSAFSDPLPTSEEASSAKNTLGYGFALSVRYWPEGRP